jgi:hypothetical protein
MRGLAGSGVQADLEARMQGEALAQLAGQVNQQEMQRLQMLGNIYADPAFGALEQDEMPNANALIALQGLLGAGMSLAPLLGGMGRQPGTETATSDVAPLGGGITGDVSDIMALSNFASSRSSSVPQYSPRRLGTY